MSSDARELVADQLARDIHHYLAGVLPLGIGSPASTWERMHDADDAMMEKVAAFERGGMSFAELEAEGVRYVEAWQAIAATSIPHLPSSARHAAG